MNKRIDSVYIDISVNHAIISTPQHTSRTTIKMQQHDQRVVVMCGRSVSRSFSSSAVQCTRMYIWNRSLKCPIATRITAALGRVTQQPNSICEGKLNHTRHQFIAFFLDFRAQGVACANKCWKNNLRKMQSAHLQVGLRASAPCRLTHCSITCMTQEAVCNRHAAVSVRHVYCCHDLHSFVGHPTRWTILKSDPLTMASVRKCR